MTSDFEFKALLLNCQGYEKYLMDMAVERDVIETARKEGVQEGLQKGERNAKLEMAKKKRSQGMDIETIIALTGLSLGGTG